MKPEIRQKLARESFAEKIRKVGQLIRLAKTFPRRPDRPTLNPTSLKMKITEKPIMVGRRCRAAQIPNARNHANDIPNRRLQWRGQDHLRARIYFEGSRLF